MYHGHRILLSLLLATSVLFRPAKAIDFFFEPDTAFGNTGEVIQFSGHLGASDLMRGFTVYMAYDTNRIDLFDAPLPGSLVANQQGLQFNYFDHAPFQPDRLEISGTVFGTDFWQGPGELFTMRMLLRSCGDEAIVAPYAPFFVAADGSFPQVIYHSALVMVCDRVPQPVNTLSITPLNSLNVGLNWQPVTQDTLGRLLLEPPVYEVFRQRLLPSIEPVESIAVTYATNLIDDHGTGIEFIYFIITRVEP